MDFLQPVDDDQVYCNTSLRIIEHIRFQKFRYEGENRPGIRKQHKGFMTLQMRNPHRPFVRVCIICVHADVQDKVKAHPNGLIGAYCHHGLYDMMCPVPESEDIFTIVIPYMHIERIRCNKGSKQTTKDTMETRMSYLPSPYKEHFTTQLTDPACHKDVDPAKIRLAVMVSVEGCCGWLEKPLAVSNVIKDGGQDTLLDILKISCNHVPAASGAWVDIFTTDKSPPIKAGEFTVYVSYQPSGASGKLERWVSQETCPGQDCILYNKVISYKVPPCEPDPLMKSPVKATLHLVCPDSDLSCSCSFYYVPHTAAAQFPTHNDDPVTSDINLIRKRSIKRSRCEPSDDSEITASVKIKPTLQGDTICDVKSNRISFPETDFCSLPSDMETSNVKVRNGDNDESSHTIHLHPAIDTHDSKFTNNNWMGLTSVHHDRHKTKLDYTNMTTETRFTQNGINTGNYIPNKDCNLRLSSSGYSDFLNTQRTSFVQDVGVNSGIRSMSSCSVQHSSNVAAIAVCDAKAGCNNFPQILTKNSSFVPQTMEDNSRNGLSHLKRMGENLPKSFIDDTYVMSKVRAHAKCGEDIVVPAHDSCRNGWVSQKQTGKDNPGYVTDNQRPPMFDWMNYLKHEHEKARLNTSNGQISDDFQENRDCNETKSVNQTATFATGNGECNQTSHNFKESSGFSEATSVNQTARFETDNGNSNHISGNFQANSDCSKTKFVNETCSAAATFFITDFATGFATDIGNCDQILHNFQINPDYSKANYASQTAPTTTREDADTTIPASLGTLDIFADMADNLPTIDLSNLLNDIY